MKLKKKLHRITFSVLGISFLVFILSFTFKGAKKINTSNISINIEHMAGDLVLKLDSVIYKNSLGQNFTVTKFKYYLGNIVLKQANGKSFLLKDYFLVNEEEKESKHILLKNVPLEEYSSLEFIIGVDSLHNCSGAQSGALDPANGMFWAWNSGYIFLKLEGISASSDSPGHIFEYHIGGYKQPHNCIRKVKLALNGPGLLKEQTISLKADLLEILKDPVQVDFTKLSAVTDFHNSETIADNYRDMFSILNK